MSAGTYIPLRRHDKLRQLISLNDETFSVSHVPGPE